MDNDYIYLDQYNKEDNATSVKVDRFYMNATQSYKFIEDLSAYIPSDELTSLKDKIVKNIIKKRKEVIKEISINAISFAANAHNYHIKNLGINYLFAFQVDEEPGIWFDNINGIGIMAMVQGIPLGNRYLNYKAYSISALSLSKKYYLSSGITDSDVAGTYLEHKLYHLTDRCPIYKEYVFRMLNDYSILTPKFYLLKSEAAENGYSPCPVCKP